MAGSTAKKPAKKQRRVDEAFWRECERLMREGHGSISYAAQRLGADRKTVRRLWLHGMPRREWGVKPMSQTYLAAESTAVAASRAASMPPPPPGEGPLHIGVDEYEQARRDALAVRAEEAKLVRAARANVQALLHVTAEIGRGAIALATRVRTALTAPEGQQPMSAGQAMLILARYGNLVGKATNLSQAVVDIEREVVGDPSKRLPDEAGARADNMTDEDAVAALERAGKLAARIAASGFVVIDGGTAPPVVTATPTDPPPAPPAADTSPQGEPTP